MFNILKKKLHIDGLKFLNLCLFFDVGVVGTIISIAELAPL